MDTSLWFTRFTDAQAPVYNGVLDALMFGRKHGCYMWYIFPQLLGLGTSPEADTYGIPNAQAAVGYLAHPVLGPRLRECTALAMVHGPGKVFSYELDCEKYWACVTLFKLSTRHHLFEIAVDKGFKGADHPDTVELLNGKGV